MTRFDAVTCLGCGCACDDIAVTVAGGRISGTERACELGRRWFGDGSLVLSARIGGSTTELPGATAEAARRLGAARGRCLIYLAPEVSVDDQRAAVALADSCGSRLDSISSDTAASGILAGQRRGRSGATLGELRERADLVVYWGVDPADRYPRFVERYLPPAGRRVVAVDIGQGKGPADADQRLSLATDQEMTALSVIRAVAGARSVGEQQAPLSAAVDLGRQLAASKYVVVVYEAEPSAGSVDPARAEGLIALTQGLNGPTRAALCTLRGGGNRVGADQVVTWQTGFPMAVDFASGAPRYQPDRPASMLLAGGAIDLVLVAGDFRTIPAPVSSALQGERLIVIGPGATATAPAQALAIDTGRAGIHSGGTAFRLDDVPLPLTAVLPDSVTVGSVLVAIRSALQATVAR
jgi:formylmethanofuran dehydrogenase subunit B